jgi:predicted transcriptional regulator
MTNSANASVTPESSEKIWAHVNDTQSKIAKIQKELNEVLESYASPQSHLTKLATYWVSSPWWLRLGIASLTAIVLITLTAILHLYLILTAFVVAFSLTSVFCYLLSEHHGQTQLSTTQFKTLIGNLTELLGSLIELLDTLYLELKKEIDAFEKENKLFSENVEELSNNIPLLTEQIEQLTNTERTLRDVITDLQKAGDDIKKNSELHQATLEEILKKTKSQLDETNNQLALNEQKLKENTTEFAKITENYQRNLDFLKSSLCSFQGILFTKKQEQEQFKEKLQEILNNEKLTLQHFAESLEVNASKLTTTVDKLQKTVTVIENNTRIHGQLVQQLSGAVQFFCPEESSESSRHAVSTEALKHHSTFAISTQNSSYCSGEKPIEADIPDLSFT